MKYQAIPSNILNVVDPVCSRGRPKSLFPFTFASKDYLGSFSSGILLTFGEIAGILAELKMLASGS